jgi:hypothetical protein
VGHRPSRAAERARAPQSATAHRSKRRIVRGQSPSPTLAESATRSRHAKRAGAVGSRQKSRQLRQSAKAAPPDHPGAAEVLLPVARANDQPAVTGLRRAEHGEVAGSGQSLRSDWRIWPCRPGPERGSIGMQARTRPDRRSRAGRLKPRSTVQDAAQAKGPRGGREQTGSELFARACERQGETRAQQRLRQRMRREGVVRRASNLSPALVRVRRRPRLRARGRDQ